MTDYIVAEGIQLENDRVPNCRNKISNRLSFLEHCIRATDIDFAAILAEHLMARGSSISTPRYFLSSNYNSRISSDLHLCRLFDTSPI